MPIYEYFCLGCNYTFEYFHKTSNIEKVICEKCGSDVKKLVSKNNFHLKGNGWYKTDYKK